MSSPRLNEADQDACGGRRVDEDTPASLVIGRRRGPHSMLAEHLRGGFQGLDTQADMVESRTVARDEATDRRVPIDYLEQFELHAPSLDQV